MSCPSSWTVSYLSLSPSRGKVAEHHSGKVRVCVTSGKWSDLIDSEVGSLLKRQVLLGLQLGKLCLHGTLVIADADQVLLQLHDAMQLVQLPQEQLLQCNISMSTYCETARARL